MHTKNLNPTLALAFTLHLVLSATAIADVIPPSQSMPAINPALKNNPYYSQWNNGWANQNNPWINPAIYNCPTCMANLNQSYPQPWPSYNWNTPYYSNPYWNNFNLPTNGYGVMPQYYPPLAGGPNYENFNPNGGSVFVYPYVYASGPDHTRLKIKLKMNAPSVLITAVPNPKDDREWTSELIQNRMLSNGATYDHFVYDARVDESNLQDQAGFCGDRNEALKYMAGGLKTRGFPDAAVQDFTGLSAIKLPWNENLCVYPQSEVHFKAVASLEIEPKEAKFIQLEFMIVPQIYHASKQANERTHFSKAPVKEFKFETLDRKVASDAKTVKVYDWGVGFLVIDRKLEDGKIPSAKK